MQLIKINGRHYNLNKKPINRNNKIFGALFEVDMKIHSARIDAHYLCSQSLLLDGKAHSVNHRCSSTATPITFDSIDDFCLHKYQKHNQVKCIAYFANEESPFINMWLKRLAYIVCKTGTDNNSLSKILLSTHGAKGD